MKKQTRITLTGLASIGIALSLTLGGCDCNEEKDAVDNAIEGADEVAEHVTGSDAIKRGEEMKKQIRGIQENRGSTSSNNE